MRLGGTTQPILYPGISEENFQKFLEKIRPFAAGRQRRPDFFSCFYQLFQWFIVVLEFIRERQILFSDFSFWGKMVTKSLVEMNVFILKILNIEGKPLIVINIEGYLV